MSERDICKCDNYHDSRDGRGESKCTNIATLYGHVKMDNGTDGEQVHICEDCIECYASLESGFEREQSYDAAKAAGIRAELDRDALEIVVRHLGLAKVVAMLAHMASVEVTRENRAPALNGFDRTAAFFSHHLTELTERYDKEIGL